MESAAINTVYNYEHSRPFDVWKWSDAPQVNRVVTDLLEELTPIVPRIPKKRSHYRNVIKKVVLDLYVAYLQDPDLFVAYSRLKNDYVAPKRYSQIFMSYGKTIEIIDAMARLGYIHHKKGFRDRAKGIGRQSRMRAEPKLVELIEQASIRIELIGKKMEEIILKDTGKRLMDYEEMSQTMLWRDNLKRINSLIMAANLKLNLTASEERRLLSVVGHLPDYTANTLYRIFNNGSFEEGGRFYGHWIQNLPKEFRKHLTIDDEPVVELDYSGLHINLLYRLAGLGLPEGDVYAIDGYDRSIRPLLKVILLIMINAKNQTAAIRAVRNEPANEPFGFGFSKIKEVMDKFIDRHAPIKHFFNSGKGLHLQFLDSQVAERILLDLADGSIACLPIHDSFIVKRTHEEELRRTMGRAFLDAFGATIGIDRKY